MYAITRPCFYCPVKIVMYSLLNVSVLEKTNIETITAEPSRERAFFDFEVERTAGDRTWQSSGELQRNGAHTHRNTHCCNQLTL